MRRRGCDGGVLVGEGARDEASEAATIVLANESTFISKLFADLTGKRGRAGGAGDCSEGRSEGFDSNFSKAVLGSAGLVGGNSKGALPMAIGCTFLPFSGTSSKGERATDRRRVGSSGTVCGDRVDRVEFLGLLIVT